MSNVSKVIVFYAIVGPSTSSIKFDDEGASKVLISAPLSECETVKELIPDAFGKRLRVTVEVLSE